MSSLRYRLICGALVLALAFAGTPAKADSILNDLFPSIFGPRDTGPNPSDTLVAPFAQDQVGEVRRLSAQERKDLSRPENIVPINLPHRSNKYIADWASHIATEALTFDLDRLDSHYKKMETYFVPYGKQEFVDYLKNSKTLEAMTNERLRIQAYAKTIPALLNEGEYSGTYRWLYDVPVTTTMLPANINTYAGKSKPKTYTQNLIVRMQIGRTKTGFTEGMAVERWTVTAVP